MTRLGTKLALLAGAALWIDVPSAYAEAAANEDSNADIIVTARRIEERLQDVPASIQVFNQQALNDHNISSVTDLAIVTPSLSAQQTFGADLARFQIRGFVQESDGAPSVGIYFADAVVPRGGANSVNAGNGAGPGAFFDLQSVQVLKGPQGTLFGRNTTGGAILIAPQKPTGKLEGYAEGSVGNYNLYRLQGVLNIPVSDTFKLRLGVDHEKRDGYLHNYSGVGPKDFANINYTAIRASALWNITPDIENYTVFSWSHSHNNGSSAQIQECVTPAQIAINGYNFGSLGSVFALMGCGNLARRNANGGANDPYAVTSPHLNPYVDIRSWQVVNTTTWRATDNLTIKNIANYAQFKQSENTEFFGVDLLVSDINPALPSLHVPFSTIAGTSGGPMSNQRTFTDEVQLQGKSADGKLTYILGAYFEVSTPITPGGNAPPTLLNCSDYATLKCTDPLGLLTAAVPGGPFSIGSVGAQQSRISYRDHAFFGQATYAITKQLKVEAGFRYTWDSQDNTTQYLVYHFVPPGFPTPATGYKDVSCYGQNGLTNITDYGVYNASNPNTCTANFHGSWHKPTWVIDLTYQPTQDIMVYAKYGRGYRAGTLIATAPFTPLVAVRPEKVDFYELGLKSSWNGAVKGIFNITGFYNNFSDQQLLFSYTPINPGNPRSAGSINAGKSKIYGLEIEGSVTPLEGLTLGINYTYLRTRLDDVPNILQIVSSFGIDPAQFSTFYRTDQGFVVGDPLAFAPRNKLSLTASYTLPVSASLGKITLSGTYQHTDSQLANYFDRNSPAPALRKYSTIPAYDLVNLNLNWSNVAGGPVDLSFFVTNLLDKKYYTNFPGVGLATPFEIGSLGEPRMFGMRVKVKFGS